MFGALRFVSELAKTLKADKSSRGCGGDFCAARSLRAARSLSDLRGQGRAARLEAEGAVVAQPLAPSRRRTAAAVAAVDADDGGVRVAARHRGAVEVCGAVVVQDEQVTFRELLSAVKRGSFSSFTASRASLGMDAFVVVVGQASVPVAQVTQELCRPAFGPLAHSLDHQSDV